MKMVNCTVICTGTAQTQAQRASRKALYYFAQESFYKFLAVTCAFFGFMALCACIEGTATGWSVLSLLCAVISVRASLRCAEYARRRACRFAAVAAALMPAPTKRKDRKPCGF